MRIAKAFLVGLLSAFGEEVEIIAYGTAVALYRAYTLSICEYNTSVKKRHYDLELEIRSP